jgi:hypothetical protein
MLASYIPYCGTLPITAYLDPVLFGVLLALVVAYWLVVRVLAASGPIAGPMALLTGRCVVGLALMSPLFVLGASLF